MLEGQEVGIHPPTADDVAAGRRQRHAAEAGQQWAGEQNRRPDLGAERRVQRLGLHASGIDAKGVGAGPLRRGAEIDQQRQHRLDVADARNVVEIDRTVGQQGGGEDRQGGVLIARRTHRSAERTATLDQNEEAWPKLPWPMNRVKRNRGGCGAAATALY